MVFVFLKIIKASLSNVLFSKVLIVRDMIFQIVAPQICTQIADTQNVCADKRFFNGRQREMPHQAQELLNLYCEQEYTTTGFGLNALSLFLMTAVDYNALNQEQLARLSAEIFNKIDNIIDVEGSTPVFYSNLRFPYLLGAFVAYHYDASLSDDDVTLLKNFIIVTGVSQYKVNGVSLTNEDISHATMIISQSLERMEQMSIS